MNWKNAQTETPEREGQTQMTDRLVMWVIFKGEDIKDGRAIFGAYNFFDEKFFAVENDIYKKLQAGKATITHWDYINTPN